MTEWRDISTAPKDGRSVLVVSKDGNYSIARWVGGFIDEWLAVADGEDARRFWPPANDTEFVDVEPTHWMPLPAPPSDLAAGIDA